MTSPTDLHIPGPGSLARLKDIIRLVLRHGGAPSVRTAGLGPESEVEAQEIEEGEPEKLARDLEAMGPTFVKLGQLLSTRPDLLPAPYLKGLARLQDAVEPVPFDEIRPVLEEELGVRIGKAFASFEETSLAAASLGQVHRATLRDGRPVAVKIQRPGVAKIIRKDMDLLEDLAHLVDDHTEAGRKYAVVTLLGEFRTALASELDYRKEAENLRMIGGAMEGYDRIVVPRPVDDYTTHKVLTMDLMRGRNVASLSPLARMEMEGPELLDQLFQAYLEQALQLGLVHADPHPGNLFLTEDGRLALLDLGMVIHLTEEMRDKLLRMLLAMGDGDAAEVARVAESMGQRRTGYDQEAFRREVTKMVDRAAQGDDRGMGRLVLGIARQGGEHGLRPPAELALIGKTLLNLDRVAFLLHPDYDPSAVIKRHTLSMTRRRVLGSVRPGQAVSALLDAKGFVEHLPRRVNRALDAIGENDLEIRVRVIDQNKLLMGLQQMANRITSGLVLASLIVGAALLMRVETDLSLLGYPLLAIVFFLAAAFGGVALLYRIWRGDRETRRDAS